MALLDDTKDTTSTQHEEQDVNASDVAGTSDAIDESTTEVAQDSEGEIIPDANDSLAVRFDYNCLKIDRVIGPEVLPPAGLRVKFRVTDCDGDPAPLLSPSQFVVVNDEKGVPFGQGLEGDSISGLAAPSDFTLYSVLALDFSESIFASGHVDDVVNGALDYLDQVDAVELRGFRHEVAILAFGRPEATEFISGFTANREVLREKLEAMRSSSSRGSTDLYGSYVMGLDALDQVDRVDAMAEKFFVLITDGTHESGDEAAMRELALAAKTESSANIYSIGVHGAYDEASVRELASTDNNFFGIDGFAEIGAAFRRIANRAAVIANSNYVVGICTPVALGKPTLTISIEIPDGQNNPIRTSITLPYDVTNLTGELSQCSADDISQADPQTPAGDNVGCSDGSREGFLDADTYPSIAGCSGGWQVPGMIDAIQPHCDRQGGNDSASPDGEGCGAADLCAQGWHICDSAADVEASSPTACTGSTNEGTLLFFSTRQSGSGYSNCDSVQANDLFGCGSVGTVPYGSGCGQLDRFSNNLCFALGEPWNCGTDSLNESKFVTKPSSIGGGVLCCADQ